MSIFGLCGWFWFLERAKNHSKSRQLHKWNNLSMGIKINQNKRWDYVIVSQKFKCFMSETCQLLVGSQTCSESHRAIEISVRSYPRKLSERSALLWIYTSWSSNRKRKGKGKTGKDYIKMSSFMTTWWHQLQYLALVLSLIFHMLFVIWENRDSGTFEGICPASHTGHSQCGFWTWIVFLSCYLTLSVSYSKTSCFQNKISINQLIIWMKILWEVSDTINYYHY